MVLHCTQHLQTLTACNGRSVVVVGRGYELGVLGEVQPVNIYPAKGEPIGGCKVDFGRGERFQVLGKHKAKSEPKL